MRVQRRLTLFGALVISSHGLRSAPASLETQDSCFDGSRSRAVPVVIELELERSDHAELAVKATLVEPVDVLDRRDLEVLHIVSGPASAKQLCFRDRSTTSGRLVGVTLEAN